MSSEVIRGWAILAVVVVTLSGCIGLQRPRPVPDPDAISIRRDGPVLLVTSCVTVAFDGMWAEQHNFAEGTKWAEFWRMTESRTLEPGDTISTADPAEILLEPSFKPDDQIHVVMYAAIPEGGITLVDSTFSLGAGGLAEDAWLHADGTVSDEPCA